MRERVLAWQGNRFMDAFCDKDTVEFMELFKEFLSGCKSTGSNCVLLEYVTEVHEHRYALDHH